MSFWTNFRKTLNLFNPSHALHGMDDMINKNLGGYGNVAKAAGIVAAGVLTGGMSGVAYGTTIGAVAGAGVAAGSMASGIEAKEAERDARQAAREQKAEVDKANALADRQRRAQLFALRKQVGAVDVGSKSSVFTGSSSDSSQKVNDIILG